MGVLDILVLLLDVIRKRNELRKDVFACQQKRIRLLSVVGAMNSSSLARLITSTRPVEKDNVPQA